MDIGTNRPFEGIEFTTVAEGRYNGPKTAKEEVIYSQANYTAFFEGSPPSSPDVNWEDEMVVAVALGERRTGGYSVEVTGIVHHIIGIRGGMVDIHYVEKISSGVTTDALTYPYHVVKCQRVDVSPFFFKTANDSTSTA